MPEVRTNWNRGQPIPASDMRRNSEALDALVKSNERARASVPYADARLTVKLTARDSEGKFEFEQVRFNVTEAKFETVTQGVTHATLGLAVAWGGQIDGEAGMIYVGDIVELRPGGYIDAEKKRRLWGFSPSSKIMHVTVTGSGFAGDDDNPCEFVYDVFAQDGEQLLSGVSPTNQRTQNGERVAGTEGYVYYKLVAGVPAVTLGWVNEEYVRPADLPPPYTPGTPDPPYVPDGSSGDILRHDGDRWVAQAPVTQEVVTDYRVDTATNKLQKKTITLTVIAKGAESGWTDVHTGVECA
jgi:hypothetical protein